MSDQKYMLALKHNFSAITVQVSKFLHIRVKEPYTLSLLSVKKNVQLFIIFRATGVTNAKIQTDRKYRQTGR